MGRSRRTGASGTRSGTSFRPWSMRRPTLLVQLLEVQTLVVALSCAILVTGAMAGSAVLLRRDQDEGLRSLGGTLCRSVQGRDTVEAAQVEFEDAKLGGYRYELVDRQGRIAVNAGDLETWVAPPSESAAGCFTTGRILGRGDHSAYRACETECGDVYHVRVITVDVLSRPAVDRAAWVVLGALPVA